MNIEIAKSLVEDQIKELKSRKFTLDLKLDNLNLPYGIHSDGAKDVKRFMVDQLETDIRAYQNILRVLVS